MGPGMDALAQEVADSAVHQAPGWIAQLESAGVPVGFIAGLAAIGAIVLALRYLGFLKGPSSSGNDREWLSERFDNLGNQIADVKSELGELKSDFKEHAHQDREAFRDLYARTERQIWPPEEERQRKAAR